MEQLNRNMHGAEGAQSCQQIYGGMEYGSIMALVTQQQQQQQSHEPNSSSYSSYSCHQHHHHNNSSTEPECMLSEAAARMVTVTSDRMVTGCSSRATMMGIGQLVSSEDVKDEDGKDNVKNSVNPPLVVTPALAHSTGKSLHIQEEDPDVIRAKIMAHVHYPRLLTAYLECQKIGAPPSVLSELETLHQNKCQRRQYMSTISIGVDPELDQFMEAYCELFVKYKEELTRPFKEATEFLKKVEMQLSAITKDYEPLKSLGEGDGGTGSSEEEEDGEGDGDGDAMESIHRHTHGHGHGNPLAEDRALKEQLLRKYSGYLSGLKQEFLKKKKKGKLPKEARQKLLDWWTSHYKWPYPSEAQKIALAEATGLDQKQINNWFINQRKRHWKPSEEMQFVVMETPATRHHPHPHIFHLAPDGNPHQTFSMSMDC